MDSYGVSELQTAVQEALQRGVPHPNAVRLALERRREAREEPPPVAYCYPVMCKSETRLSNRMIWTPMTTLRRQLMLTDAQRLRAENLSTQWAYRFIYQRRAMTRRPCRSG